MAETIKEDRLKSWNTYYNGMKSLERKGLIELPFVPDECEHNGITFYIKVVDLYTRDKLMNYLKGEGICSVFHYIPLHSSDMGERCSRFVVKDDWTTREGNRLLRLPMYYKLAKDDIEKVIDTIKKFMLTN